MKKYTMSGRRVNLFGLLFIIPVLLIYGIPYILIWGTPGLDFSEKIISCFHQNREIIYETVKAGWIPVILIILAGIVLHELIHGIFMAAFSKNGWRSVLFGFNIKALAPYAHCREPLTPTAYRICLIMPALLLGDIPVLIAWISGNILFLFFGVLFAWTAFGDLAVLWLSREIETGLLQDHPDKMGFIRLEE